MLIPALLLAWLTAVPGHPLTVAILRPATPSAVIAEAVIRLRGELASEGLATAWLEERDGAGGRSRASAGGARTEAPSSLAALAETRGLDAAVALSAPGRGRPFTVEVWVVDKAKGRSLSRELPVELEGEPNAKVLAIRAAELLRSSLVELDLVSARDGVDKDAPERAAPEATMTAAAPGKAPATNAGTSATTTPTGTTATTGAPATASQSDASLSANASSAEAPAGSPSRSAEAANESPRAPANAVAVTRALPPERSARPRFGVAVGGVTSASFDGASASLDPWLHLVGRLSGPWALGLSGAGGGVHATVNGAAGSAKLSQTFVVAGLERELPGLSAGAASGAPWALTPFVALSLGALRTFVKGEALAPHLASEASQWSMLVDGSAGARLGWRASVFVEAAARLQVAAPYPSVRFDGQEVATTARPNLGLSLALGAWL